MIYPKQPKTTEEQADQLLARGLVADRAELIRRLTAVNYYRLTGYLYPFRIHDAEGNVTDRFAPSTTLELVWNRYCFDRRLRALLLDSIERIEVCVRTRLVYHFAHYTGSNGKPMGAFGHLQHINLPGFRKPAEHANWLAALIREQGRANDTFVAHFIHKYGDMHPHLPLWVACELMTCGTLLQMANAVPPGIVQSVAADFGFPDRQLLSWAKALFSLRNSCAHHARIWNRVFGLKPSIPKQNKNPSWHLTPGFAPDRIGLLLTVCHVWLGQISHTSQWRDRLFALFDEYPSVPLHSMGLPSNWRSHPLWQ